MAYNSSVCCIFYWVFIIYVYNSTFGDNVFGENIKCPEYANESSCQCFQRLNATWKPSCEPDGTWSAKQCKGELSNGRCFCYNSKGIRIFGWNWWADAQNMTCACSRRREELKKKRNDVSLHCTENGNYEELQCDNGLCWCVDSRTGQLTQRFYPESAMKFLPCYQEEDTGSQYLRQCESKHIARIKMLDKLRVHGIDFVYLEDSICDDDGSYGAYKIVKDIVKCTWKDSQQLELYQGDISQLSLMNCNCARDTRIFSEAGIAMTLICQNNGNYKMNQYDNGRPFCVDDDGYPTTPLGAFGENLKCPPTIVEIY